MDLACLCDEMVVMLVPSEKAEAAMCGEMKASEKVVCVWLLVLLASDQHE